MIWKAVARRWRRNILTVLAMMCGVAAVVSILGVSQASSEALAARLQSLQATTVTVTLPPSAWDQDDQEFVDVIEAIPGVVGAGTLTRLDPQTKSIVASPLFERPGTTSDALLNRFPVVIATERGIEASGARLQSGTYPASAVLSVQPRTVLMGSSVAQELALTPSPGEALVKLDGELSTLSAVIRAPDEDLALAGAVVLPPEAAESYGLTNTQTRTIAVYLSQNVDTAALQEDLPLALWPQEPSAVSVTVPPSATTLRDQLLADSRGQVWLVSGVVMVASMLGIMLTMQAAVAERRREIGIDRSIGQTKHGVALDYLAQAALLGLLGSVSGTVLGVVVTAGIVAIEGWELSLPPEFLLIPLVGVVVGTGAGTVPAIAAARTDPLELLRS